MPTRRVLELAVVVSLLMRPIFGLARLWSAKTLYQQDTGSISHGVAEVVAVIA